MASVQLDDLDVLLVNALQVASRASWSHIGAAIGVDPSTLAARWRHLSQEGIAWTGTYPNTALSDKRVAFIEVGCVPSCREAVTTVLAADPRCASIEWTTGPRDLFLTIMLDSLAEIDDFVADRLGAIDGVRTTRTHHVRTMYREGSRWDVRRLNAAQRARLEKFAEAGHERSWRSLSDFELEILEHLGDDARRSATEIATSIGASVSSVSRGIARLISERRIVQRCDIAHERSPWSTVSMLALTAPHDQLASIAGTLEHFPQVRMCCSTVSRANLLVQTWLRSIDELDAIEETLASRFPAATVVDRWIISRNPKRMGHLIEKSGRRVGFVPLPNARAMRD